MFKLQYMLHNTWHYKMFCLEDKAIAIVIAKLLNKYNQNPSLFYNEEYEYNFTKDKFECLW